MALWPSILLLATAVSVGLYMALRLLKGEHNKPVLIGLHFFCGAATLEVLAVGLGSTPGGFSGTGALGKAAMLGVGMALFTGIMQPLIGKSMPQWRTGLFVLHAATAALAFGLVVLLANSLQAG